MVEENGRMMIRTKNEGIIVEMIFVRISKEYDTQNLYNDIKPLPDTKSITVIFTYLKNGIFEFVYGKDGKKNSPALTNDVLNNMALTLERLC